MHRQVGTLCVLVLAAGCASRGGRTGTEINFDALQPEDLVFFTTVAPGASHVGVWTGSGQFVHAPSGWGEVRVERLISSYWTRRYLGARRVVGER